jgi:DNA-binding transcriptional regulator PaaX
MGNREIWKKTGIGVSKAILIALFAGAVVIAPWGVASAIQVVSELFEGKEMEDFDQEQMKRALKYLRRKKLIEIQEQYQKEVFGLTKLGWLKTRKLLKSFGISRPKKWDRKWRIVIFDIPNTKKNTADVFRRQLRNLGLANLQKSIWVHPYECREQIYYLAGNLFIKPYVRYIVAEEVTGERDLRSRFGL